MLSTYFSTASDVLEVEEAENKKQTSHFLEMYTLGLENFLLLTAKLLFLHNGW